MPTSAHYGRCGAPSVSDEMWATERLEYPGHQPRRPYSPANFFALRKISVNIFSVSFPVAVFWFDG